MSVYEKSTGKQSVYAIMVREKGVSYVREFIRDTINLFGWREKYGAITHVQKKLWCSRPCIYRALDWPVENRSRAPISRPLHQTETWLEEFVLKERSLVKYGRVRMSKHLFNKYGITLSSGTIRNIYRRGKIQKHVYVRSSHVSKPLYDYEHIAPFEYIQVDVKYIEDFEALWPLCLLPRKRWLPLYQWTAIDAKTKTRFLAYSHTLSSEFGMKFILMIGIHLRSYGIPYTTCIHIQTDNGSEFCRGSKKKEEEWNTLFMKVFWGKFQSIPAGKKYLQWIVERSHRTDDEELYRPKLECMENMFLFFHHAGKYHEAYNCYRPSFGIGMNGMTPLEKLTSCSILWAKNLILDFPILLLENLSQALTLKTLQSVNDVQDHYQRCEYLEKKEKCGRI